MSNLISLAAISLACYLTAFLTSHAQNKPEHSSQLIFPLESWHNHGSCILEASNGDLIACWFHGSGERRSDDVKILGARKLKGSEGKSIKYAAFNVD